MWQLLIGLGLTVVPAGRYQGEPVREKEPDGVWIFERPVVASHLVARVLQEVPGVSRNPCTCLKMCPVVPVLQGPRGGG